MLSLGLCIFIFCIRTSQYGPSRWDRCFKHLVLIAATVKRMFQQLAMTPYCGPRYTVGLKFETVWTQTAAGCLWIVGVFRLSVINTVFKAEKKKSTTDLKAECQREYVRRWNYKRNESLKKSLNVVTVMNRTRWNGMRLQINIYEDKGIHVSVWVESLHYEWNKLKLWSVPIQAVTNKNSWNNIYQKICCIRTERI